MRGPFKFKVFDRNQIIASGHGKTLTETAEEMNRRVAELEGAQVHQREEDRARRIRELKNTRRGG